MFRQQPTGLFAQGSLFQVLEQQKKQALTRAASYDKQLLIEDLDGAVDKLVNDYALQAPKLGDYKHKVHEGGVEFEVTFDGDPKLFDYLPSTFESMAPQGDVQGHKLVIHVPKTGSATEIKEQLNSRLGTINRWLSWIEKDVAEFNSSLHGLIEPRLRARKEQFERDQALDKELGS